VADWVDSLPTTSGGGGGAGSSAVMVDPGSQEFQFSINRKLIILNFHFVLFLFNLNHFCIDVASSNPAIEIPQGPIPISTTVSGAITDTGNYKLIILNLFAFLLLL